MLQTTNAVRDFFTIMTTEPQRFIHDFVSKDFLDKNPFVELGKDYELSFHERDIYELFHEFYQQASQNVTSNETRILHDGFKRLMLHFTEALPTDREKRRQSILPLIHYSQAVFFGSPFEAYLGKQRILPEEAKAQFDEGVLVGADRVQECLLPWWWEHYSKSNHLPVVFCDFGLSKQARAWCENKGQILDMRDLMPILNRFCTLNVFFYKAFALLNSPFHRSIWTDIDCAIYRPLSPLFNELKDVYAVMPTTCFKVEQFQLVPGQIKYSLQENEIAYDTAIIATEHQNPLILEWAKQAWGDSHSCFNDQSLLSRIIYEHRYPVKETNKNWFVPSTRIENPAYTIHYAGLEEKKKIMKKKVPIQRKAI